MGGCSMGGCSLIPSPVMPAFIGYFSVFGMFNAFKETSHNRAWGRPESASAQSSADLSGGRNEEI